jgi:hypothetical protein
VEILEDRCVLTTTVTQTGNSLAIVSDSGNQINVKELSALGGYSVQAGDFNGNAPKDFSGVSNISVSQSGTQTMIFSGFSGDTVSSDTTHLTGNLTITSTGALTLNVQSSFNVDGLFQVTHRSNALLDITATGNGTTLGKTTIKDTGSGDSSVTFINGVKFLSSASLNLGNGAASVAIGSASTQPGPTFGSFLSVISGSGDDTVNVVGADVGQNFGLALGTGNNQISVDSTTVAGNLTVSDSGTEKFTFHNSSTVDGNMSLNFGGSNPSTVSIGGGGGGNPDAVIKGFLSVVSGAGNDTISVTGAKLGTDFAYSLGTGTNTVTVKSTTIGGNLSATDAGAETFSLTKSSTVTGNVSLNFIPATSASVTIGAGSPPDVTIHGFLSLLAGSGSDTLSMTGAAIGGNTSMTFGPGSDSVTITKSTFSGFLSLTSTTGNNNVTVTGSSVGQNLAMAFGGGTDSVKITNSAVTGSVSVTASGTETYTINSTTVGTSLFLDTSQATKASTIGLDSVTVAGATQINTGAGADSIVLSDSTFKGAVGMVTGNGADTVVLENTANNINTVFFGTTEIQLGAGNDQLTLGKDATDVAVFHATVKFDGGTGTNTLTNNDAQFLGGPPVRVNI